MKTEENVSLEITRLIKAPRERVYQAWTDPAQIQEWFGPDTTRIRRFTGEIRTGGKYQWDVVNSDGEEMTVRGEYREIVPGRKIVFTWSWDDDENWEDKTSIVTIELFDAEGGTELRLRHEQLPSEASRDRHHEGWGSVVDSLDKYLTSKP